MSALLKLFPLYPAGRSRAITESRSGVFGDPTHQAGNAFLETKTIYHHMTDPRYVLSSFESPENWTFSIKMFQSKMVDDQVWESMKILNIAYDLLSETPL